VSSLTSGPGKAVIGVVHLRPLPGTPFYEPGSLARTVETAIESARSLDEGGADGCLVQTADRVYSVADEADPACTAAMAMIVQGITAATRPEFRVGVQIMRNAAKASIAVAKVADGSFVRVGALVGATLSNHGLVQPNPHDVMSYRQRLDAWDIGVVADIDSMHFSWLGGGKPTADVARAAKLVGADAVCLGSADEARTIDLVRQVHAAVPGLPVILAGHTNHGNVSRLLAEADGAFVGSCLTRGGWDGLVDVDRVRSYVDAARAVQ
jgi:membrane complex biogenesis BtpA family protein